MKLGIVLSMFPEHHETFIVRELAELERQGVGFEIFSLQRPRDPVTHEQARALLPRTHYASLCGGRACVALARTILSRPLRLAGAVARLVAAGWRTPVNLLKALVALPLILHFGALMRERGVTHLHGHWANIPTTACWLIGMIFELPWSAAIHGENIFTPNPLLSRKLQAARFAVVCTSYHCRHLKETVCPERASDIHLNYHGLEPRIWQRLGTSPATGEEIQKQNADAEPVILAVGRLVHTKGLDVLLRAVAMLEALRPRVRIIGAGPEEARLKALAAELHLTGRVEFLGQVPFEQVVEAMERADVFALPCTYDPAGWFDGIPNVLAEAMALGTPVVSTTVSGIPELIENGKTGLLVPEKDPAALADALGHVLTDRTLADRLARDGKAKVRCMFDIEANVAELGKIFSRYAAPGQG